MCFKHIYLKISLNIPAISLSWLTTITDPVRLHVCPVQEAQIKSTAAQQANWQATALGQKCLSLLFSKKVRVRLLQAPSC